MNNIRNLNLIDKEVLILSILILLGSLAQIKYMIDYNRNKLGKERYPIITMIIYILLIFTYSIIAIGSSNQYTLKYYFASELIMRIFSIIIVLLSIFTIIKNWLYYDNKLKQLVVSIIITIVFPVGIIFSILMPIISIITIPYKYLKHNKLNK